MTSREVARTEMPAALRREVRLLGDVLGQVLAEYGGPGLLEDVELLRRTVIAARDSDAQERAAASLVASWSIDRAEQVARAFTCYFQLVNLAEERHRARTLREREHQEQPILISPQHVAHPRSPASAPAPFGWTLLEKSPHALDAVFAEIGIGSYVEA